MAVVLQRRIGLGLMTAYGVGVMALTAAAGEFI